MTDSSPDATQNAAPVSETSQDPGTEQSDLAAPAAAAAPAPAPFDPAKLLVVDLTRLTLMEIVGVVRPSQMLLLPVYMVIIKFNRNLLNTPDRPAVKDISELRVAPESTSPEAAEQMSKPLEMLRNAGFTEVCRYHQDDRYHAAKFDSVVLFNAAMHTVAWVGHRTWAGAVKARLKTNVDFITPLRSGGCWVTSNLSIEEASPPAGQVNVSRRATPEVLLQTHRQRLEKLSQEQDSPLPLRTGEEATLAFERYHANLTQQWINRGILRPPDAAQIAKYQSIQQSDSMVADLPDQERAVFAYMNKPRAASKLSSVVTILVISLIAFLIVGRHFESSWRAVLILVGVLFVHEMGHYLAMMLFGYRDMKMFFLPGLGAAVSGRAGTVPGWKRVLVALAGPLPSIMLGAAFGIVSAVTGNRLLMEICAITLIINCFNLIPILPFDGGHVIRLTLTNRNMVFDLIFRALAAVCLILLGIAINATVLSVVGALLIMGLGPVIKRGKIVDSLRKSGLVIDEAPDSTNVSEAVGRAVIPPVVKAFPKMAMHQQAQQAQEIIDDLAAKPPGIAASIGLLGLYASPFILLLLLIVVGLASSPLFRHAAMLAFSDVNFEQHWQEASTASLQKWSGAKATAENYWPRSAIIGRCQTQQQARDAYEHAIANLPPTAEALCVGKFVAISMPDSDQSARREWTDLLETKSASIEVSQSEMPSGISLSFSISDPVRRKAFADESNNLMLYTKTASLIPPWVDPDPRTPELIAQHRKARKTHEKLQSSRTDSGFEDSAQSKELNNQLQAAFRKRDNQRITEINLAIAEANHKDRIKLVEKLRGEPDIDPIVCDLWLEQMKINQTSFQFFEPGSEEKQKEWTARSEAIQNRLIERLGSWPQGSPPGRSATNTVYLGTEPNRFTLICTPKNPVASLPMILLWLEAKGAQQIKVQLSSGFAAD